MTDKVVKATEEQLKKLDVFTISLNKTEILDLITILTKEYHNNERLLEKFTNSIKETGYVS